VGASPEENLLGLPCLLMCGHSILAGAHNKSAVPYFALWFGLEAENGGDSCLQIDPSCDLPESDGRGACLGCLLYP
jgi:hypothetical protein